MTNASGTPQPWSVDLLADLHAGVLDETEAAELRQRVQDDSGAQDVLAALDATSAELADLGAAPAGPMPAEVADKIDAALAVEAERRQASMQQAGHAPVVSLDAARKKRRRRIGWSAGIVTAAAAAVAAVAIVGPSLSSTSGTPVAAPDAGAAPQSSSGQTMSFADVNGHHEFGAMDSKESLIACLDHAGVKHIKILGSRKAKVDGKPAVAATLTTGKIGTFRFVAVPSNCGPGKGKLLYDKVVGAK